MTNKMNRLSLDLHEIIADLIQNSTDNADAEASANAAVAAAEEVIDILKARADEAPSAVRVGVLGSTRGTDLQALIDAATAQHPSLRNIAIAIVISNRSRAGILARARAAGISAKFLGSKAFDAVSVSD